MKIDFILFAVFPYVAVALAVIVSLFRYFSGSYKFSSLSSEFLETNKLFWGSVAWHYGIITVLTGHFLAFLFPDAFIFITAHPTRLVIFEVFSLICGLLSLFGVVTLIKRRNDNLRIARVTTKMDVFILLLLLIQVLTGVGIAIMYRWGSAWFASSMTPYLRSLWMLNPEFQGLSGLPALLKLHIANAMLIIAVLPFTRLLHFLVLPVSYIWRSWQVVIWNWDRKTIRK